MEILWRFKVNLVNFRKIPLFKFGEFQPNNQSCRRLTPGTLIMA